VVTATTSSIGNARQRVFHKDGDFESFLLLFAEAHERCPMRLLAYCLMPSYLHRLLAQGL